ncbi:hypothetical protein QYE76_009628 [Lolium multiflorum]|uniref:Uncharacterized protein n=1 Tax=Lolium multiflorum TaxID=4521 RepID=A0AAD8TS95_LOLMU|nr:hypothetical protein QYE76_009628 [Lolium multiflorum]
MNGEKRPHHVVEDHLHIFGMDRTYVRWVYHGEPYNDPSAGEADLAHTMDGREGEKKRLLQETGFSSGTCAVPDEKKHRVEEVSQFDGRFEDESQFDAPVDGTDDEPFIDEGPTPEIIQPTEGGRGPSTQLCVEVDARPEIITSGLYRKGKTSIGGGGGGQWSGLYSKGRSKLRLIRLQYVDAAPSSKCLYKHKATHQLGGDLLMNMAETAAPLLKWMQNEAAVRTMVPAPSSENLYKHEAMGQLGGDLLMNLTETAKPSLVKRIATAADEASAEAATKLLSAPPSGCLYKLKSKDQPGRNHPRLAGFNMIKVTDPPMEQSGCHKGHPHQHGTGFPLSRISTGSDLGLRIASTQASPSRSVPLAAPLYRTAQASQHRLL